jgi:hypothetical protein
MLSKVFYVIYLVNFLYVQLHSASGEECKFFFFIRLVSSQLLKVLWMKETFSFRNSKFEIEVPFFATTYLEAFISKKTLAAFEKKKANKTFFGFSKLLQCNSMFCKENKVPLPQNDGFQNANKS